MTTETWWCVDWTYSLKPPRPVAVLKETPKMLVLDHPSFMGQSNRRVLKGSRSEHYFHSELEAWQFARDKFKERARRERIEAELAHETAKKFDFCAAEAQKHIDKLRKE